MNEISVPYPMAWPQQLRMVGLSFISAAVFCIPAFVMLASDPDQPEGMGAIVMLILSPAALLLSMWACHLFAKRSGIYLVLLSIWVVGYFIFIAGLLPQASGLERAGAILYPLAVAAPSLFAGRRDSARQAAAVR
jgi:hypothetical protein